MAEDAQTPEQHKEGKRERFLRLAEPRTQRVLDALRVLGNCSNRVVYDWNESDLKQVFGVIEKEIERVKERFQRTEKTKFSFKGDSRE